MIETWKPVVGFEGFYEVSDQGRVRSLSRYVAGGRGSQRFAAGKLLSRCANSGGYLLVVLCRDSTIKNRMVHSLVLEAFVGPRPAGADCCHNNGDRTDPSLTNLRWDTRKNNFADKILHGTSQIAERHGRAKLTRAQVDEIRSTTWVRGMGRRFAKRFGVSPSTIGLVKNRKVWA